MLVDADSQESASEWVELREECPFGVVSIARSNLHIEVKRLRTQVAHVVIDGPPRGDGVLRSCLAAAERIVQLIDDVRIHHPQLDARFVVNRKQPLTRIGREVRALELGPPILESEITQRVAFNMAMTYGQTVAERVGPDDKASLEVAALAGELLHLTKEIR